MLYNWIRRKNFRELRKIQYRLDLFFSSFLGYTCSWIHFSGTILAGTKNLCLHLVYNCSPADKIQIFTYFLSSLPHSNPWISELIRRLRIIVSPSQLQFCKGNKRRTRNSSDCWRPPWKRNWKEVQNPDPAQVNMLDWSAFIKPKILQIRIE